jgi:hypothetical protein
VQYLDPNHYETGWLSLEVVAWAITLLKSSIFAFPSAASWGVPAQLLVPSQVAKQWWLAS